jgi:uncharacterized protein (DUF1330 family)
MAFYVVWDAEITNRPGLEPYVAAVSDTIAKHGGRYLSAGPCQAHRRWAGTKCH